MKANKAPEKIWIDNLDEGFWFYSPSGNKSIEYIRTDVFIEKARKWFGQQPETYDANGVRVYGDKDFEDFKKYIEKSS